MDLIQDNMAGEPVRQEQAQICHPQSYAVMSAQCYLAGKQICSKLSAKSLLKRTCKTLFLPCKM